MYAGSRHRAPHATTRGSDPVHRRPRHRASLRRADSLALCAVGCRTTRRERTRGRVARHHLRYARCARNDSGCRRIRDMQRRAPVPTDDRGRDTRSACVLVGSGLRLLHGREHRSGPMYRADDPVHPRVPTTRRRRSKNNRSRADGHRCWSDPLLAMARAYRDIAFDPVESSALTTLVSNHREGRERIGNRPIALAGSVMRTRAHEARTIATRRG